MKKILVNLSLLLFLSANGLVAFSQEGIKEIEIKVLPGLQFDVVRFQVKPGTKVKLIFKNTDEMDHNLLITKPGAREKVVNAALEMGGNGPVKNYIPETPQVMWSIPIVSADQSKSIVFTAPKEEGIYPYVCTYPGHGYVMYGAMYVSTKGQMPTLSEDVNIPISRREDKIKTEVANHHEATAKKSTNSPVPPYLYRVYIDGASPAAIAVSLTDSLSYCWDAGVSKLRFAWKGGFVDNSLLWKGHTNATSIIIGAIFYRDQVAYPLQINNKDAKVSYKGYRLINRYPEFHYTVNGLDVYELIKPLEQNNGFSRSFRIPEIKEPMSFIYDENDGVVYDSKVGKQERGKIELSATEAKSFTIIMIAKK